MTDGEIVQAGGVCAAQAELFLYLRDRVQGRARGLTPNGYGLLHRKLRREWEDKIGRRAVNDLLAHATQPTTKEN